MIHTDEFNDGILIAHETNHGDGTGTRYEYDPDGTVVNETPLAGMPVLQTPRETLIGYLDAMTDEQAAPVLTVLGWIATLTPEQAAALTAALAATMQGGSQ